MAHFAEINENNIVIRVLVIPNEEEDRGQEFLSNDLQLGGNWLKTSYNTREGVHLLEGTPFRKNYAGIGFTYDINMDAFIPPKPFPSWILDELTCTWHPPIPRPDDNNYYNWNEDNLNWDIVDITSSTEILL